jgi:hypothetical protein
VKYALLLLLCLALFLSGCETGPEAGTVTGQVTLDGQPVDGGMIRFIPVNGESQPGDSPITAGAYSATMPVGEKKVEITWGRPRGGGAVSVDTASQGNEVFVETIPRTYNGSGTTLRYTVVKGEQKKDFALTK